MRERYDNNKRTYQQKRDFILLELKATRRSLTMKEEIQPGRNTYGFRENSTDEGTSQR